MIDDVFISPFTSCGEWSDTIIVIGVLLAILILGRRGIVVVVVVVAVVVVVVRSREWYSREW
jgi:hypothetical protein